MEFQEYYIVDKDNNSNCIIRTMCKLLNREYDNVKKELLDLAHSLDYETYIEIKVFEKYLENNGYTKESFDGDIKVKDLRLVNGKYAVFCYDKKDFYHMLPIIDKKVYDRVNDSLDLFVLTLYTLKK